MTTFADQLFREVNPGFFRVLAGSNAAVHLDVLDALEREATERHEGMSREEALAIVSAVLAQHPAFWVTIYHERSHRALTEQMQAWVSFGNFYPEESRRAEDLMNESGDSAVEKLLFQNDS